MSFVVLDVPDEGGGNGPLARLGVEVRDAAYNGSGELWSAVLEILDTDIVRTVERALRHLYDMDSAGEAMRLIFALYGLCEMRFPKRFTPAPNILLWPGCSWTSFSLRPMNI